MKKKWIYVIPAILCVLLAIIHVEVVAKYRTKTQVSFPTVSVRLFSRTYDLPQINGTFVYDGTEQGPTIIAAADLIQGGTAKAINAGTYEITISLPDPVNDQWADGTNGTKTYSWTIEKRRIEKPYLVDDSLIYTGEEQSPEVSEYSATYVSASGLFGEAPQEYEAVFSLTDLANTTWVDGSIETLLIPWDIYVCRIGEVYYHSVTDAFATDTSSDALPVTMLCNWEENCVNATGVDAFFLDGFTVNSHGTTIKNEAELTISGPGTLLASTDDMSSPTVCENTGTLTIQSGVFRAEYSGTSTGPNEAYCVLNQSGTAKITDGTFSVTSSGLAAEPLCANGGTIIVEGGDFSAIASAATHGAYGGWLEGGDLVVRGGTFYAENKNGFANGFDGTSGHLTIEDATVTLVSTNGKNGSCVRTQGTMTCDISGGNFSLTGEGKSTILQAAGNSTMTVSGGTFSAHDTVAYDDFTHGFLADGGAMTITGGTFLISTVGGSGVKGATGISGSIVMSGGDLTAYTGGSSAAFGCYLESATAEFSGMNLKAISDFGHVIGLYCPMTSGSISATSGSVTLIGKTIRIAQTASSTNRIVLPSTASAFPITVKYGSYYQTGQYWSTTPAVTATQITEVPASDIPQTMTNALLTSASANFLAANIDEKMLQLTKDSDVNQEEQAVRTTLYGNMRNSDFELTIGRRNHALLQLNCIARGEWLVSAEETDAESGDANRKIVLSLVGASPEYHLADLYQIEDSSGESELVVGAAEFFEGLTLGVSQTPLYGVSQQEENFAIEKYGWVVPLEAQSEVLVIRTYQDESGFIVRIEIQATIEQENTENFGQVYEETLN